MSIGPYYQGAVYSPFPFQELMAAGQLKEARLDKSNAAADELGALVGALQAAPGHEDYKTNTLSKFNQRIKDLTDNIDPSDPRFAREARKLKYEFMNDPDVQTIHESKQVYDKEWNPLMTKLANENPIYNNPGIMDYKGNIQPNQQRYSKLNFLADPKYKEYVNKDLSVVDYTQDKDSYATIYDKKLGKNIFVNKQGDKYRDLNHMMPTIKALVATGLDQNGPYFNYMKTKAELEGKEFNEKYLTDYAIAESQKYINRIPGGQSYNVINDDGNKPPAPLETEPRELANQVREHEYDLILDSTTIKPKYELKPTSGYAGMRAAGIPAAPEESVFKEMDYGTDQLPPKLFKLVTELLQDAPKDLTDSQKMDWVHNTIKSKKGSTESRLIYQGYDNPTLRKERTNLILDNSRAYKTIDPITKKVANLADVLATLGQTGVVIGKASKNNMYADLITDADPNNIAQAFEFTQPEILQTADGKYTLPISASLGEMNYPERLPSGRVIPRGHFNYLVNGFTQAQREGLPTILGDDNESVIRYVQPKDGQPYYKLNYEKNKIKQPTIIASTPEELVDKYLDIQ